MTRRVVVGHIQRLGELALDGFGAFSLGTKSSAMTRAATALKVRLYFRWLETDGR